jgi:hypothetical protein
MKRQSKLQRPARREFVRKAAYVAPAILTLAATPSHATVGSAKPAPSTGVSRRPPVGR